VIGGGQRGRGDLLDGARVGVAVHGDVGEGGLAERVAVPAGDGDGRGRAGLLEDAAGDLGGVDGVDLAGVVDGVLPERGLGALGPVQRDVPGGGVPAADEPFLAELQAGPGAEQVAALAAERVAVPGVEGQPVAVAPARTVPASWSSSPCTLAMTAS